MYYATVSGSSGGDGSTFFFGLKEFSLCRVLCD